LVVLNVCVPPKIINTTNVWNNFDTRQLKFSLTRCPSLYKDAPCLKLFWKYEENSYRAICGRNEK